MRVEVWVAKPIVKCPVCGTLFRHSGKDEPQKCPECGIELPAYRVGV